MLSTQGLWLLPSQTICEGRSGRRKVLQEQFEERTKDQIEGAGGVRIYTSFMLGYPKQPHFSWESCPTQSKASRSGGNSPARPDFGRQKLCHSSILHLSWCNIKTMAHEPGAGMDLFPCPHPPTETWHGGTQGEQLS